MFIQGKSGAGAKKFHTAGFSARRMSFKRFPGRSWLVIFAVLFLFLCGWSDASADPFKIPEKFVYDLTWTGIKAGTASLELICNGDEVRIVSTARSADWLSLFYTVEDRAESILSRNPSGSELGLPTQYRLKVREGRHRKDKEVFFDRHHNRARYIDHLSKKEKDYEVPDSVLDPISSFYHLRLMDLVVGKPVYVTIFDSKKVWNVEVQVLGKERITVPVGTFDTILVKPLMKSEGIFYRKGEIFIWLTDDAKRIPVKMQTKVAVGSITASLVHSSY